MKKIFCAALLAAAFVWLGMGCKDEEAPAAEPKLRAEAGQISQRRAEAMVRFLSDDLLEGRGTPSRGLDIAALYLANELRSAGWQPAANGSYFQTYTLKSFAPESTMYSISINGIPLGPEEYTLAPFGLNPELTPVKYNLVFAGYGIFAPEKNVDDFAMADVRGKAVVSILGAPWPLDPAAAHAYDRVGGKDVHVTVRGGKLLVYVSEQFESPPEAPASVEVGVIRESSKVPFAYLPEFQGKFTCGLCPILAIKPSAFDKTLAKLTGGTYADWKKRLPDNTFKIQNLEAAIEIRADAKLREGKASNIVAMLPGTDNSLSNECIVLTAHYDHLGFYEAPPGKDGIYNGANDNASGTAGVLEIARRLAEAKPRRSVLIVMTSGEEMGLLGSAIYSIHPLVPNDRVIVNINADGIGSSSDKVFGCAAGCDELLSQAKEAGKIRGIEVLPDPYPSWRLIYFIDSYHFARLNIPYIEFMTELQKEYHQPSDEAELIRYEGLGHIIDVIYELTNFYAQGGKKPVFKRPDWFLTPEY